jgi:hypothetical protein
MFHRLDHLALESGLDGSFACYTTLDRLPNQSHALYLLRRCAYIIDPIMRRHGWNVPNLHELSPYSSCHGKCLTKTRYTTNRFGITRSKTIPLNIELRLRDDGDTNKFIHMQSLIRTMLHELAHFVYRRHFVAFYKFNAVLLGELVRDVESGEMRRRVDWDEVPEATASMEEILYTMTRELKKGFVEMIGVGKKDRYRYGA